VRATSLHARCPWVPLVVHGRSLALRSATTEKLIARI
jgi:hypothetical protein